MKKKKKKLDPMTQPPLPVLDITYAYELEVGAFSLLRLVSGATEVSEEFTWCFFFFLIFYSSWLFLYYLMAPSPSPLG